MYNPMARVALQYKMKKLLDGCNFADITNTLKLLETGHYCFGWQVRSSTQKYLLQIRWSSKLLLEQVTWIRAPAELGVGASVGKLQKYQNLMEFHLGEQIINYLLDNKHEAKVAVYKAGEKELILRMSISMQPVRRFNFYKTLGMFGRFNALNVIINSFYIGDEYIYFGMRYVRNNFLNQ